MIWCVVPAAGAGTRAGGEVPKQYQPLLGRTMLDRTLARLARHPEIAGMMVALAPDDTRWPGWVLHEGKPVRTCDGGRERADSVRNGLAALLEFLPPDAWVMVHDAARPAVRLSDISELIRLGTLHPVGALLALPVGDTLKRADDQGTCAETVSRERLWRALTPQIFRLGELYEALGARNKNIGSSSSLYTDEAGAMESIGRKPLLVESCADNIKLTRASDRALLEAILVSQGER